MTHLSVRVLVTGASGHVGANLVRALLKRGQTVRALVHSSSRGLSGLDVEIVSGDVRNTETLCPAFRGVDLVYHCAARISISRGGGAAVEHANVEGTANVVRACLDNGVERLVHFSSIHAIKDPGTSMVIDETTPLALGDGAAPYDRSKARAERLIMDAVAGGLDAVVIAPTAVIGPHDYRPSHLGRVLLTLARGRMPALVDGGYDWVDVRDVVEGAIAAAGCAPAGAKYLLSGHWTSLAGIAGHVARIRRCRRPFVCLPDGLGTACGTLNEALCRLRGADDPLFTRFAVEALSGHRNVSHERATRDLGYAPRPLHDTIVDTVRWFESNGSLARCEVGE